MKNGDAKKKKKMMMKGINRDLRQVVFQTGK